MSNMDEIQKSNDNRQLSHAIVSNIYRSQRGEAIPMTPSEDELIRKTYMEIIEKPSWKEELIEIGNMIKKEYLTQREIENIIVSDINLDVISTNGNNYKITKEITTVGRHMMCDILSSQNFSDVSRFHAIIFIIENMVLIVDIGSCYGIKMIERESKNSLIISAPNNRNVIYFDKNEKVSVRFGCSNFTLLFSPKQCVVCLSNPRSLTLEPCGHMALCVDCYQHIMNNDRLCPLCRIPIVNMKNALRIDTYLNN